MDKTLFDEFQADEKRQPLNFQTIYNRHDTDEESTSLPSETVPNQALGIQELLRRHMSGQIQLDMLPQHDSTYEDVVMPDLSRMTPDQQIEAIDGVQEQLRNIVQKIKDDNPMYNLNDKFQLEAIPSEVNSETKEPNSPKTEGNGEAGGSSSTNNA